MSIVILKYCIDQRRTVLPHDQPRGLHLRPNKNRWANKLPVLFN